MSNDYFKAQGWFKTYALNSQDSRGVFQQLVKEDEEAFRLASAETDKIKAMMNKKYGPGTMKYGSEIKQPEIKTPQAIFEFGQRNPAAEGGRMRFDEGLSAKQKKALTITYPKDATKDLEIKKSNPGANKVFNKALDSFYNEFGKEVVDAASIQDYGVTFDKLKGEEKRRNFKKYFKQDMEDYGEYIGTKNPDKDRRTMKRGIRAEKEAATKIKLINAIKNGEFLDVEKFAQNNNITVDKLKAQAKQLQTNIYIKRGIERGNESRSTLKWLTDDINETDNVLKTLAKSKLIVNKSNSIGNVMFDAFGRKNLPGTNTPNPNFNLDKLDAIKKNFNEYDILKKYLKDNFNIITELDHPLDKKTIQTLMNSNVADLTNVNILEKNLNTGFKKTLNDRYLKAVLDGNLDQKRAVEKIAKQFKLNIGSVPDNQFKAKQVGPFELNKIDKGVGSFETLDIKKEMLKSLKNADKLNTEWGKYIKDNPDVFKTAGIDLKKLKKPKNIENIANNIDEIEKYITDRTGKVKQPSSFIGLSSGFNTDLVAKDLKKIMDTESFKTFKANIADPALEAAGKTAKVGARVAGKTAKVGARVAALPTKVFGGLDLVLGYLDYSNNRQKGFSKADSTKHMVDAILFGATSFGEKGDIAGVREIANKNNMSNEVFDNLMALNLNQKKMMDTINESKAKFNESMDIIESGVADPTAEKMLIQKLKVDTKKSLTNTMKNIVDDSRSLNTNLQVQKAGAPININVDTQKAYSDLGSASREFVQNRINASDPKVFEQGDTTMGRIGSAIDKTVLDKEFMTKFFIGDYPGMLDTKAIRREKGMAQLKKEDPTTYYKMLMSEGVDPRINLNLPVQLEFEQKYPQFGSQLTDGLTQNKAEGGITQLRSKYEYKK